MKQPNTSSYAVWLVSTLGLLAVDAAAQDASAVASSATTAAEPSPYYLGVSQGFTYDSNVYRIPGGKSDAYSSTSVFGGFDQPISRQRLFGRAAVSYNRYRDEDALNNTSYDLSGGLDWETIGNVSGNINAGASRRLAAPTASSGTTSAIKNVVDYDSIDLRARYGGPSILTLEGSVGFSRVDYSAPEYSNSDSRQTSGSLGLFYRPSSLLRAGIAARVNRTRQPQAFFDSTSGTYQSNDIKGRNLDLLADYELTGQLSVNGRVSYTRQTNTAFESADFSGLTGSLGVNWRATGRTSVQLSLAREAGFDTTPYTRYTIVQTSTGFALAPVTGLYENNRVTNSASLGVSYSVTAKINANAGARYSRARIVTTSQVSNPNQTAPDSTDRVIGASVGASYAFNRAVGLGCNASHESRDVSGAIDYSYNANSIGCAVSFTWR